MDIGSAPDVTMGIAPEIFVKLVWILSAALLFLIIYYLINIGNRFVPDKKVIHYNTRLIVWVIVGLFGLYFITKIFNRYPLIADTFYTVIISLILAYFLNPLVDFFEKKGLNRFISTVLVYLIILGTIVILTISVLPRTGRELRRLATNFPGYITAITNWLSSLYSDYTSTIEGVPELVSSIEKVITQNVDRLQAGIANGIE
ncbi:MAG: AI-2E family transporter, partial [Tissierellia bacterium]|nr:AI-2E family transporter [Tissierellia bacterium]